MNVKALLEEPFASPAGKKYEEMKVFLSYSHKDREYMNNLQRHLSALKLTNQLTVWDDTMIVPGSQWDDVIRDQLQDADIVLLLISADFLASRYVWEKELPPTISRARKGDAILVPIFVRPCELGSLPILEFQGLPKSGRFISSYRNRDEAYLEICKELRRLIAMMASR